MTPRKPTEAMRKRAQTLASILENQRHLYGEGGRVFVGLSGITLIARALMEQDAAARREGLEMGAKVADAWQDRGMPGSLAARCCEGIAKNIRALTPPEAASKPSSGG